MLYINLKACLLNIFPEKNNIFLFIEHLFLRNKTNSFFATILKRQVYGAKHHECGVSNFTDIFQSHVNLS